MTDAGRSFHNICRSSPTDIIGEKKCYEDSYTLKEALDNIGYIYPLIGYDDYIIKLESNVIVF